MPTFAAGSSVEFFYLSKHSKYIPFVAFPVVVSSLLVRSFESHVIVYLQPPGQKQYRWDSFSCTKRRPVTRLQKENYKVTRNTGRRNDLASTIIIRFRHFRRINPAEFPVSRVLTIIVRPSIVRGDICVKSFRRVRW